MSKNIGWWEQIGIVSLLAVVLAISGRANAQDLVQNGDFNNPGIMPNNTFPNANVTNWSAPGPFVVIYAPFGANTGSTAPFHLWGPADNINNGLTATSPNGNNYLADDADPNFTQPITQSIQIIPGTHYVLSFDYAAAQYTDRTLPTKDAWQVNLSGTVLTGPGSSVLNGKTTTTPVLSIGSQGFSGWMTDIVNFIAPGSGTSPVSELLSFLAVSPSADLPPVALLDSVSILPICVAGTAASYMGTTCVIDDKVFSNFKYTPTTSGSATASDAAHTTITPVNGNNNEGFDIRGIWNAGPGGAADGVFSYTVQSLAGDTINDASLSLTGSVIGGFATVGETICEGDLLPCPMGTSATLQADLPGHATAHIMFPPTDMVDIVKDIDVFGGTGFASLSDVINTVSQCTVRPVVFCTVGSPEPAPSALLAAADPDPDPVPEPSSVALLGFGLAGLASLGLIRRSRSSMRAASEGCAVR